MSRHNTDLPNPSLSWLAAGTWCWVTAHMGDEEADNSATSTICSLSAQKAEGPVPHMPTEAYQNEKSLRYEDIQLLLYRRSLFSFRTDTLHELHSNLRGTPQKIKIICIQWWFIPQHIFYGGVLLPVINFIPFQKARHRKIMFFRSDYLHNNCMLFNKLIFHQYSNVYCTEACCLPGRYRDAAGFGLTNTPQAF